MAHEGNGLRIPLEQEFAFGRSVGLGRTPGPDNAGPGNAELAFGGRVRRVVRAPEGPDEPLIRQLRCLVPKAAKQWW